MLVTLEVFEFVDGELLSLCLVFLPIFLRSLLKPSLAKSSLLLFATRLEEFGLYVRFL